MLDKLYISISKRDLLFVFAPEVPPEFVCGDLPRTGAPQTIKLEDLKLADKLKEEGRVWLQTGGESEPPIGLEEWAESWKRRMEWGRTYTIRNKLHREHEWRKLFAEEMSR